MIYFALLLIPAILVTLIAKFAFHKDICGKESLLSLGINMVASLFVCGIIYFYINSQFRDEYIVNGEVIAKQKVKVSGEHSYSCNCVTSCSGSGTNQTCTTTCQTCYDHPYDFDWLVKTSVGSLSIDRVDRQGKNTPPRWSQVKIGEPVALTRSFNNYLLAVKDSLFNHYTNSHFPVPSYPMPYDYYRINRVFGNNPVGSSVLNDYLSNFLINKRFNIVVLFTDKSQEYKDSLMNQWKGSKRNDVILVYGMSGSEVVWFFSDSYGKGIDNRLLHDKMLFSAINSEFTKELFVQHLGMIDKEFKQVDTEQFEHLKSNIKVPSGILLFVFLLNISISVGVAFFMKRNKL